MSHSPWVWPSFDPVIISIGPLALRWYGLMYLLGFYLACWLAKRQACQPGSGWQPQAVASLLQRCFFGLLIGGRIGYLLFYQLPQFLTDPLLLLRIWQGGMSFHGGLLGAIMAMWWFAHGTQRPFLTVADFIVPLVPLGLGLGRLGNFINGELWGRITEVPWGVIFPHVDRAPRHPSQLNEAGLEGVVLFLLLQYWRRQPRPKGTLSGLFLAGYGLARFTVEYWREPDPHLAALARYLKMGQLLSLPMVAVGLMLLCSSRRVNR